MVDLQLRGPMDWFTNSRITVEMAPSVRSPAFWSPHPDFQGLVEVGDDYMYPFDFRSGSLTIRAVAPRDLMVSHSETLVFRDGRIQIGNIAHPESGSLTDFAMWGAGTPGDPKDVYVDFATAAVSGHTAQAWTRHNATFAVPKNAYYIGIGGKYLSMPNTGNRWQYLTKAQLEVAPLGASVPSAYSGARELQVTVYPEKINYSPNPAFWVNTNNWIGLTRTANTGSRSGWSGDASVAGTLTIGHNLQNLIPGKTYLAQFEVTTLSGGTIAVVPNVSPATGFVGVPLATSAAQNVGNSKTLVHILFRATASSDLVCFDATGTETIRVYSAQVEESDRIVPLTPFDGYTGGDYVWEFGGTNGGTRSYYYKNRAERAAAISRILAENVPMGIGVGAPKFGVPPLR